MPLIGKMETIVEVKSSAAKFHEVFGWKPHIMVTMSPKCIQGCDLAEGQWGKPGCIIICWKYFQDGILQCAKEKVEIIDNENFITNFKSIEGSLLEKYKSICTTVKVIPKEDGSLLHWILEYEKLNEDVPDPSGKIQLVNDVSKDIDAYLLAQQTQD